MYPQITYYHTHSTQAGCTAASKPTFNWLCSTAASQPSECPVRLVIQVVKGASKLLLTVLGGLSLVDTRPVVGRIPAKGDVQSLQEGIHACQQTLGLACRCSSARFTIIDNDPVCQVCGHDEIVLHNECCLLGMHDEALDHLQHIGLPLRQQQHMQKHHTQAAVVQDCAGVEQAGSNVQ